MIFNTLKTVSKKGTKWGVAAAVSLALFGAGSAAYAGFAVGSIGSAKSLQKTPSADVFGNALDNLKIGQLSTEDLDKSNINYSACGTSPLPQHVLDYLETVLNQNAVDTSDWQSDIDAIADCDADAAVWQLTEANSGNADTTTITADVLDEAIGTDGYTNSVLGADSSKGISDVQALFPNALSTPPAISGSRVKTLLAETVLGFDSSAQADGYHANSDKANYTVTTYKACYNSSSTYTTSSTSCTISKASWDSIDGVQDVADNSSNQLTDSLITGGLALKSETKNSAIDTSSAVHLRYLEDCISGASDAITQLSTCNTGFTVAKAALFYVAQIAAGASGYPTSALTIALLQDAGMAASAHTNVGATLAQLKSNITTSGITTASSGTDINDWVTEVAGFNSGTTYSTVTTATTNGWTLANYKLAEDQTGWTNSTAHKNAYNACVTDMTTCNYSYSHWNGNLSVVPTLASTSQQTGYSSEGVSYNISSLISTVPEGYTITNLSTGYSASGGTISNSSASDGTVTFRVENASNSNKYVTGSFVVDVKSPTQYKCHHGSFSGMTSAKKIGQKCRQLNDSSWEAMLDGDRTDTQKRQLCDVHNDWTDWANWGRTAVRHNSHYISRQFHGQGSGTGYWHSSEHNCPGSSGCGGSSTYILCTKYQ